MKSYFYVLLALIAATALGWFLHPVLEPINIALIYLLVVVLAATSWGFRPAILAALLGVLILDALFVPPYGLISISQPQDFVTYAVFVMVGLVIGNLGSRLRTQLQLAQRRQQQAAALYALSQDIAFRNERNVILDAALTQIQSVFQANAVILMRERNTDWTPYGQTTLDPAQQQLAQHSFDIGGMTYGNNLTAVPLETAHEKFGVLLLARDLRSVPFHPDETRALEAFATQLGVALEHQTLTAQAEQARILQANESFYQSLLSSLSHDLRTPLTVILGATYNLEDETMEWSSTERRDFLRDISTQTRRLNRRIGNLLEMTRLESSIRPRLALHSIPEVVDAALGQVDLQMHPVETHLEPSLPLVSFDFGLVEQVLSNLIENAVKFSPSESPIEIWATHADANVEIAVRDHGIGIPPQDMDHLFEKFYRGSNSTRTGGSGLGLMICKGIVEAHGGHISAESLSDGGARVRFTLPARDTGETV